jgi:hypothetical protein
MKKKPDRSILSLTRLFFAVNKTLKKYPDLRVGQIIVAAFSPEVTTQKIFNIENDDLTKLIEEKFNT